MRVTSFFACAASCIGLLMVPAVVQAQFTTFTTHPTSTGLSGDGGGVFFDLEAIGGSPLQVVGFDFNTWSAGTNVEISVYTKSGTWFGHDTDPGAWTLHDTVTTDTTGISNEFVRIFIDPMNIATGDVTGVYFYIATNGIRYASSTSATWQGNPLDDGTMRFHAGIARSALFGGSGFGNGTTSFRGYAGNILYIPAPGAIALLGLAGACGVSRRRRA